MRTIATCTVVLAATFAYVRLAGGVEITACGQVVGPGETGQLRADLECARRFPFGSSTGVQLERGATLDMNGFTIRGDGTGVGVACSGTGERPTCHVNGPGAITGFWAGMNGGGCRFVVRGVTLWGSTHGIFGPLACVLETADVHIIDNAGDGIWVTRLRARNLTVSGNGGRGVVATRLYVRGLTATDNAGEGVLQLDSHPRSGRLVESMLADNDAEGSGYDVAAGERLRLFAVQCGRSAKLRYPPVVEGDDDVPEVVGSFGCSDD
jgi:hypothetical protein